MRWARRQLTTLVHDPPHDLRGGPIAVELAPETGIELLWDTPNPNAPRPWTAADGGWAWHLAYSPDKPIPPNDNPAGTPGLVTIGTRQGRQLLIDLEAFGSLSLAGDPERANDLARAITVELGVGDGRANAQVFLADLDIAGIDQLRHLHSDTTETVLRHLNSATSTIDDPLERSSSPSTFPYRTSRGSPDITAIVARADNPAAKALVDATPTRRRVATILIGPAPNTGGRITIEPDGLATLDPLGLRFQATALPALSPAGTGDLLDKLSQPTSSLSVTKDERIRLVSRDPGPEDPLLRPNNEQSVPSAPDLTPASGHDPTEPTPSPNDDTTDEVAWPEILVKVLGRPHLPDHPNLRRRELALVVYLASKAKPTPATTVQHTIWGGRAIQTKTIWNVATATRAALGQLADGRPAMPPSQRAHNTLALAPEVRTDLQILEDLYDAAQHAPSSEAIDLLQRGLELIEGQPFDSPDCEWAHHTELLVTHANRLIEDATEQLVELATTTGRIDLARHAITQGLRALPGNEVLYRTRMTLEHDQNNLAAVHAAYTELETYLAVIDTEPSPATTNLYRHLRPQPQGHVS